MLQHANQSLWVRFSKNAEQSTSSVLRKEGMFLIVLRLISRSNSIKELFRREPTFVRHSTLRRQLLSIDMAVTRLIYSKNSPKMTIRNCVRQRLRNKRLEQQDVSLTI